MSPMNDTTTGPVYWRSLDDLARTPEFREAVAREFPNDEWDQLPPATRRGFLKVMGASLALAGLTACRWPKEEIVPYALRPDGRTPGVPEQYATSLELLGGTVGLLVTSFDGRPVKAEGNPEHPESLGALSATAQAAVLGMYDPDRSRTPIRRDGSSEIRLGWAETDADAGTWISGDGTGVAILADASSSPTLRAVKERFLEKFPAATWTDWAPVNRDVEHEGARLAFGRTLRVVPRLTGLRVIAAFGGDFLNDHPSSLRLTREFANGRKPDTETMNRLWVAESGITGTGAMADHRLPIAAARIPALLAAVAHALEHEHGLTVPAEAAELMAACPAADGDLAEFATELAADLADHAGEGALLVGAEQPKEVHALALVLNQALGNVGRGIQLIEDPDGERPSSLDGMTSLVTALNGGAVETLVILGGNPVYDAPADLDFAAALAKAGTSIHLSLHDDETSKAATWHLPMAHPFESWSDSLAWDGLWTLQQPLIAPLYDGHTAAQLVALLSGEVETSPHKLVQNAAQARGLGGVDFARAWRNALHDGFVADSAAPAVNPGLDASGLAGVAQAMPDLVAASGPSASAMEVVLTADPKLHDGRFANNGWLQELPEAITKVTWDNALIVSPKTAAELGVVDSDVVTVEHAGRSIDLPVCIVPGGARHSATVWLGHGRTVAGQVGTGVGASAYALRTTAAPSILTGVSVRPAGRRHQLATTQDHWAIDDIGFEARNKRSGHFIREVTLDDYLAHPEHIQHMDHHPPLVSLWKEHVYEGEQWGMAIDLNACTGCNACVVACQAENNIPVVGREEIINGREMHWLRIDRYFKSQPGITPEEVENAEVAFQPMACVHCENAPCEQVCPVAATQHTPDGLNAMAYNRCVGTRYCANNCPYKVRRFNFFNYHKNLAEISKMQFNPEVTVRARGVMEKCTFCIQRIEAVRIPATNERRPIRDGEITPACAQTCPAEAITFGNLNDPESRISALRESQRSYAVLTELNVKPRTHYMARLRNPAGGGGAGHGSATPAHGHDASHGKESA
jgi:MoCo/4Fe-4S cofactor protein with predicted Tat translocation signal